MFHGFAFLTFNRQGGPSGDRDFSSQNHLQVVTGLPDSPSVATIDAFLKQHSLERSGVDLGIRLPADIFDQVMDV